MNEEYFFSSAFRPAITSAYDTTKMNLIGTILLVASSRRPGEQLVERYQSEKSRTKGIHQQRTDAPVARVANCRCRVAPVALRSLPPIDVAV